MKRVAIQVEANVPRPTRADPTKMTKAKHRQWVTVGWFPVLYLDKECILVRQFGVHSLYRRDGHMRVAGYSRKHPQASKVPERHGGWRIAPESVAAL